MNYLGVAGGVIDNASSVAVASVDVVSINLRHFEIGGMVGGVAASCTSRKPYCRFHSVITALLNLVVGFVGDQRVVVPEIHSTLVVVVGICPRIPYLPNRAPIP